MADKLKLAELFNAHKQKLYDALLGVNIIKENQKAQTVTCEFFENLLSENGEYRMELTASEDYILQAALSISPFVQSCYILNDKMENNDDEDNDSPNSFLPLGGTLLGGAVGAITLGKFASVLGGLLGTAVVIYLLNERNKTISIFDRGRNENYIDSYMQLIETTCKRIDDFMDVVRAQFDKMKNSFENKEERTLANSYPFLVNALKDLVKEAGKESSTKDSILSKIEEVKSNLTDCGI